MSRLPAEVLDRVLEVCRDFEVGVERDAPMARYTSAGVGGRVACVASHPDPARIGPFIAALRDTGAEVRPLGNGTNLLVQDDGGPWVVVRLGGLGGEIDIAGTSVSAPAGMSLPFLVRQTVRAGLRGLEHAEGIPGTVGGATVGNAGCYGGDMGAVVREYTVLRDGGCQTIGVGPDAFGYRCSPIRRGEVVLSVRLELTPDDPEKIRADTAAYRKRRLQSQPIGRRSAGCVFKNPEGESAGRLIDAAGLKGSRMGAAAVSEVHANFLVNEGGATTSDFLRLIERIQDTVRARFGVDLEPEVEVWRQEAAA